MTREIDDRVRESIEKKAKEFMDEMKNTSPTLQPNCRCSTQRTDAWIEGDTVDLEKWR